MSTTTYTSTNSRPCASCGQPRRCLLTCPDRAGTELMFGTIDQPDGSKYIYLASGRQDVVRTVRSIEPLFQPAEIDPEPRTRVPRVPVGAMGMIVLGLALMAVGFLMNEPVSWAIYRWIHS